jgi:hypothetical protein
VQPLFIYLFFCLCDKSVPNSVTDNLARNPR